MALAGHGDDAVRFCCAAMGWRAAGMAHRAAPCRARARRLFAVHPLCAAGGGERRQSGGGVTGATHRSGGKLRRCIRGGRAQRRVAAVRSARAADEPARPDGDAGRYDTADTPYLSAPKRAGAELEKALKQAGRRARKSASPGPAIRRMRTIATAPAARLVSRAWPKRRMSACSICKKTLRTRR